MPKTLWMVVPTFNEAANIEKCLTQLFNQQQFIQDYELHVLVVDDKSPDNTAEVVRKIIQKNPRVELLLGDKNGIGDAYRRAYKYLSKEHKPDLYGSFDADMSHDATKLPQMIDQINLGKDVSVGSRRLNGAYIPGDWPIMRILNTRVAGFVGRKLAGITKLKDLTAGYRLMRAHVVEKILATNPGPARAYAFFVHISRLYEQHDLNVGEVPITFTDRMAGESKIELKHILEFLNYSMSAWFINNKFAAIFSNLMLIIILVLPILLINNLLVYCMAGLFITMVIISNIKIITNIKRVSLAIEDDNS